MRYAQPDAEAQQLVIQGRRTGPDACESSLARPVAAGHTDGTRYDEIAYDGENCRSLLEISKPTGEPAPPDGTDSSGGMTSSAGPAFSTGSAGVAAVAPCENPYRDTIHFFSRAACIHSWFQDPAPANIRVNQLTNEVQWNPDGSCAQAGWAAVSYYLQWVTTTGW